MPTAPLMSRPDVSRVYVVSSRTVRASNVVNVFNLATDSEIAAGMAWYGDALALARTLDPINPRRAAGVIAALSPQTAWGENKELAVRAFADGQASGTFGDAVRKANAILAGGEPMDILGGAKVRAFFLCIADPANTDAVCIDRHAFDVAMGRTTNDITRRALTRKGILPLFNAAYKNATDGINLALGTHFTMGQMQAITWLTWRRLKGIDVWADTKTKTGNSSK